MRIAARHHTFTEDEYFAVEARGGDRHEWSDGQILLMAGGSARHDAIAANVSAALVRALADTACQALAADQRLRTPDGLYTYADGSAVCGTPDIGREHTLLNPIVVVEVLSDATRVYDRGEKLLRYQAIPSVQHVLLVEQARVDVEHWRRGTDGWSRTVVTDLAATLDLDPTGISVGIAELYGRALSLPS